MRKMLWGTALLGAAVAARAVAARRQRLARLERPSTAGRLVGSSDATRAPEQRVAPRNPRRTAIPAVMAAAGITLFSRVSHGNSLKFTFVPALAASWALFMMRLRRRGPDPARLMPLYFVALAWQFVHFIEENATGFRYRWPVEIFEAEPYGDQQFVAINVLSYAVFVLGGVALMTDRREFALPAVFFAVMGVMVNGVQHPLYSLIVKGYFPGLWTSTVDLALGPMLLKRMFE